ncbi:hypothetical protein ACHQM5_030288 [Ranunculus cassubicifolius]
MFGLSVSVVLSRPAVLQLRLLTNCILLSTAALFFWQLDLQRVEDYMISCRSSKISVHLTEDVGTMCDCEPCSGRGWLVCTFCNGQKTNVKSENNRIYRRCPSCRAIGYVLCSKCKVFKCVTFPDYSDTE